MGGTVQANDGAMLPIDSLPISLEYAGGFISTITTQYAGQNYVQTFLNNGTSIIYISNWINPAFPIAGDVMISEDGEIMVAEGTDNVMITEY